MISNLNFPCVKLLPITITQELSDYEVLCKIINKINVVIDEINNTNMSVEDLKKKFIELKNYIDDFFKNLDLQEEVNKKLEEMKADGSLVELITKVLSLANKINAVDNDDFGTPLNLAQPEYQYPNLIDFGTLKEAPMAKFNNEKGVDISAFFYNDFGLTSTASSPTAEYGNYLWYDWSWNKGGIYPDRFPLIGWYNGDNATVLDWICYWLVESGVKNLIFPQVIDLGEWSDITKPTYWLYNLFNNAKNFKSLYYTITFPYNDIEKCNAFLPTIDNLLTNYENVYQFNYNGKKWVGLYCFDMNILRGTFDGYGETAPKTIEYLEKINTICKNHGFDGACFIGRHVPLNLPKIYVPYLYGKDASFVILNADYSTTYVDFQNYNAYADGVTFPSELSTVNNVVTAKKTVPPHPSKFDIPGTTPELFAKVLNKAIVDCLKNNKPKMVTIYNVSEWAEGGPGLIPNMETGFGYLDAIKHCLCNTQNNVVEPAPTTYIPLDKNFWRATVQFNVTHGSSTTLEFERPPYRFEDKYSDYAILTGYTVDQAGVAADLMVNPNINFSTGRAYVRIDNLDTTNDFTGWASVAVVRITDPDITA